MVRSSKSSTVVSLLDGPDHFGSDDLIVSGDFCPDLGVSESTSTGRREYIVVPKIWLRVGVNSLENTR